MSQFRRECEIANEMGSFPLPKQLGVLSGRSIFLGQLYGWLNKAERGCRIESYVFRKCVIAAVNEFQGRQTMPTNDYQMLLKEAQVRVANFDLIDQQPIEGLPEIQQLNIVMSAIQAGLTTNDLSAIADAQAMLLRLAVQSKKNRR